MAKPKVLFLCHRIPYPPNKGDKIRSFNLLKALSRDYEVFLGCFIDDAFDYQYEEKLADWCVEYNCRPLHKTTATFKALRGFINQKPLTLPYYHDSDLQDWVDDTIKQQKISTVVLFSAAMAQYVDGKAYAHLHRVLDLVDVDSDKWRQYAEKKQGVMRYVYRYEAKQLQKMEQHYCQAFSATLLVSEDEAKLFQRLMPATLTPKIHAVCNGVDVDYFDPARNLAPSESQATKNIVFTGAMDYWANVDAVCWFVQHVWPIIHERQPDTEFFIVGGNPTADVQALTAVAGVHVTGRVDDIRPYIAAAAVVVAPLRIARGIQNKVLEAMAMDKAIVATSMAMEGINAPAMPYLRQADDAIPFADACLELLNREQLATVDGQHRTWIIQHFTWQATLAQFAQLVKG